MKLLILITCSLWAVNAASFLASTLEEWKLFKQTFNKSYQSEEEEKFRMKIYMDNKLFIEKHNEKFRNGEVTFELGVNKYSDLTHEEFSKIFNGYKRSKVRHRNKNLNVATFEIPSNVEIPKEINWVEKGAVTPVKDQRHCDGGGWAFSATGSLEGQHFLKNGTLVSLSEQNLIDCETQDNRGCNFGYTTYGFSYIQMNGGIDTESSYPFKGEQGKCLYDPHKSGATVRSIGYVDQNEEALKAAVATVGPISVVIDATKSFVHYQKGIFVDPDCKNSFHDLNHAVLVVGYGSDNETNQDYWLVKNSWSEKWGENGYIRMLRNGNNQCGIATDTSYPLV